MERGGRYEREEMGRGVGLDVGCSNSSVFSRGFSFWAVAQGLYNCFVRFFFFFFSSFFPPF